MKIILIVVLLLLFLGMLFAGACAYFVYRTRQGLHQFQKQVNATFPVTVGTPGAASPPAQSPPVGPLGSAAGIDPASLVYPGATAKEGASLAMGAIRVQQYVTDDPVDKVVSFYKDKLGPNVRVLQTGVQTNLQLGGADNLVSIVVVHDATSGKTSFSVTRYGK